MEVSHLFDTLHLSDLLLPILFLLLSRLINPSNEPLDVTFMPHPIFVLLSRGRVIRYIYIAVFAKVLFLGNPVFAHDRMCDTQLGKVVELQYCRVKSSILSHQVVIRSAAHLSERNGILQTTGDEPACHDITYTYASSCCILTFTFVFDCCPSGLHSQEPPGCL